MTIYVSMLRAVNVGGTSRIKMDALRVGDGGFLQLPPLSAEEIKALWFEQ